MVGGAAKIAPTRAFALASFALIIVAIALLPARAGAASGWQIVLDRPTPNFGAVDFVSDSEGWMPAGAGLLHTTDGGATWTENAKISVYNVDFFDQQHGWAVGPSGAVYGTTDGGTTWTPQNSGTSVHVSHVHAITPNEAWVVGYGEGYSDVIIFPLPTVLLHTTDGGATWQHVDPPPNSTLREIAFVGLNGWILGDGCEPPPGSTYCNYNERTSFIRHTMDAGETWQLLTAPPNQTSLQNLTFLNDHDGWLTGTSCPVQDCYNTRYHSTIFRTIDAGATWESVDTSAYGTIAGLAFRDALHGWALGNDCQASVCVTNLLSTDDGGATWYQISQNESSSSTYGQSLIVRGSTLYETGSAGLALRSLDQGRTWQEMETPAVELWDVATAGVDVAYAAGGHDILRTDDAGQTWRSVARINGNVRLLAFSDETHGIAASWDCSYGCLHLYRTTDGGASWQVVHTVSQQSGSYPIALQLADGQHGLLALERALVTTNDGGTTWEEHQLPQTDSVIDGDLADAAHAWTIVHSEPTYPGVTHLQRSLDGGRTWEVVPDQSPSWDVEFADAQHGWYTQQSCDTGCSTRLFSTQDGGATWNLVNTSKDFLSNLFFVNSLVGWGLRSSCDSSGCRTELVRSGDGGRTWAAQVTTNDSGGAPFANSLDFSDAQNGWYLLNPQRGKGFGGGPPNRTILYHTTDGGGAGGTKLPDVGGRSTPDGGGFALPLVVSAAGAITLAASLALRRRRA